MSAFREAHARSTALHERAPDNGQRLFDLAQAEYWIGYVAWQQGRLDDAEIWLRKYRDSAVRLAAMDRANFEWQQEVMYGYHNLAVLDESRAHYTQAESGMHRVLDMLRGWSNQQPTDTAMRAEMAETMSWLGLLSAKQGKLQEAETFFLQEVEAFQRNAVEDPDNSEWKQQLNEALLILAKVHWQRGRRAEATTAVNSAVRQSDALADSDPDNADWQIAHGVARWWQANLAVGQQGESELHWASESVSLFQRALLKEPNNERVRNWLIRAHQLRARLKLGKGDLPAARADLVESEKLIEAGWEADPKESLRLLRAESLLLNGELSLAAGSPEVARAAWQQVESLLLATQGDYTPFERLDPLVRSLRHLGREQDAATHQQRLANAGYVPDPPWPSVRTDVAAR
jgi:tetratricopeptide (TPR) repeat protein